MRPHSWVNADLSSVDVRQNKVGCIEAITAYEKDHVIISLTKITVTLKDLADSHHKHINECSYDKVIPLLIVLGSIGTETKSWVHSINSKVMRT
jgi:demethoxyubiquinone hydroxylase (CLK1/Coq7/Cat5 family)